ncbi:Fungal specific transcription factor domain-containing protein isoform 2 [Cladophialophora immunda]|nr:Fungal specific transcription factor domain-containing protein isoform 1 [Cladophialophora immunda]OQU99845.1 Fungal specific transcription factor domain-containing protein isoform 2 [Cladophialophora immunda]
MPAIDVTDPRSNVPVTDVGAAGSDVSKNKVRLPAHCVATEAYSVPSNQPHHHEEVTHARDPLHVFDIPWTHSPSTSSDATASKSLPNYRTYVPGRTVLYAGFSSDQDVNLLRHLPFDETQSFGTDNWRVWKAFPHETAPAYFTSYPDFLLDCRGGIYDLESVGRMVRPHQASLMDLYYSYVHPQYPILESRETLERAIKARSVPSSLLAGMYVAATSFLDCPPEFSVPLEDMYTFIFRSVTFEGRTPSLRTIQAILLYMQLPPLRVREPNHPGFWALTSQAVALAQDIGLHVDPGNWNISPSERKIRRVLWWATYMQDKWLAHWLGMPSHIKNDQFNVEPLNMDDFSEQLQIEPALSPSVEGFVELTYLTTILSNVLDSLYTVRRGPGAMTPAEVLSHAGNCQSQLREWQSQHHALLTRPNKVITDYVLLLAYYGIVISIQRALFSCVGGTSYYDIQREGLLFHQLFAVFEELLKQEFEGLWLSYCKPNIAILGTFMITALLSSTDDEVYLARRSALDEYRGLLDLMAERLDFAALPRLRLNLLVERFSSSDSGIDPALRQN